MPCCRPVTDELALPEASQRHIWGVFLDFWLFTPPLALGIFSEWTTASAFCHPKSVLSMFDFCFFSIVLCSVFMKHLVFVV